MTREDKIGVAEAITRKNMDDHNIHMEEDYIEATVAEVVEVFGQRYTDPDAIDDPTKRIWGLLKSGTPIQV